MDFIVNAVDYKLKKLSFRTNIQRSFGNIMFCMIRSVTARKTPTSAYVKVQLVITTLSTAQESKLAYLITDKSTWRNVQPSQFKRFPCPARNSYRPINRLFHVRRVSSVRHATLQPQRKPIDRTLKFSRRSTSAISRPDGPLQSCRRSQAGHLVLMRGAVFVSTGSPS